MVSVNTAPKNYIIATRIGAPVPEKYVDSGSWPDAKKLWFAINFII